MTDAEQNAYAAMLAALRTAVDMLQECLRNADNDTADTIDAVLIEAQRAITEAEEASKSW